MGPYIICQLFLTLGDVPNCPVASVTDNIIDYCYGTEVACVQRANLGISVGIKESMAVYDVTTGLIKIKEAVSVYGIPSGSLADGVLQDGDVLVSIAINGKLTEITRQYHALDLMLDMRVGDQVTLNILRDGEEKALTLTIAEGD